MSDEHKKGHRERLKTRFRKGGVKALAIMNFLNFY